MTERTTAVERIKARHLRVGSGRYYCVEVSTLLGNIERELSRCRRETLTEVEGLVEQTPIVNNSGYFDLIDKNELRTKLKQLKGE